MAPDLPTDDASSAMNGPSRSTSLAREERCKGSATACDAMRKRQNLTVGSAPEMEQAASCQLQACQRPEGRSRIQRTVAVRHKDDSRPQRAALHTSGAWHNG